jgi:hypothetical protein
MEIIAGFEDAGLVLAGLDITELGLFEERLAGADVERLHRGLEKR